MSESIIIGVDHGYAAMKTAHFSFHTGLVAHEHEPYTLNNVLEYGGKYYVVGSGRQPLQKDKTQTEDYYLLTLAAIAKELAYRNAGTAARTSIWQPDCRSPASAGIRKRSGTTCAGAANRCPSAMKDRTMSSRSPKCRCIRRAMPQC